ncbi:MAG TPA: hypothetical protein VK425_01940, partial [Acidimicrobiales bacterium]|nr:hypothetical protein [Acidimicrobiales bacterium]
MLEALSQMASRHPKRIGLLALLVFVLAGAFGAPAAGMLNARNPFQDPGSQSARAEQLVQRLTGKEVSPGVLAVVAAPPGSGAVSSVAKAISAVPGVAGVTAPVAGQPSPMVSSDGRSSVVAATLQAAPNPNNVVKAIESALGGRHDVVLGGADVAGYQTGQQALA